jgi:hypothetical protein
MSSKIMIVVAATALLASTALASAQTQASPRYWGGSSYFGYGGYGGYYGQMDPLGDGIGAYNYGPGPGIYYGPPGYSRW